MSDLEITLLGEESEEEPPEEREINLLHALESKGPALPVELAVRTYSFPEEIAEPLNKLEQKGLVERQAMRSGEMVVLTRKGQHTLRQHPSVK